MRKGLGDALMSVCANADAGDGMLPCVLTACLHPDDQSA